jgi:hypothetical protein
MRLGPITLYAVNYGFYEHAIRIKMGSRELAIEFLLGEWHPIFAYYYPRGKPK